MNNENAFLTKVESYKKMLFYFYIKMKQNNDRINIYISRISKPEFEEGVLQSKQNDFFQLPINEKN